MPGISSRLAMCFLAGVIKVYDPPHPSPPKLNHPSHDIIMIPSQTFTTLVTILHPVILHPPVIMILLRPAVTLLWGGGGRKILLHWKVNCQRGKDLKFRLHGKYNELWSCTVLMLDIYHKVALIKTWTFKKSIYKSHLQIYKISYIKKACL